MKSRQVVTTLFTALALAGAMTMVPAYAQTGGQLLPARSDNRPEVRPRISAAQAAAIVQNRFGGQVVDVEAQQAGGRFIYRVRILQDDGRVRTVRVNGETGEIMGR